MTDTSQDQLVTMAQITFDEKSSGAGAVTQKYLPVALFLITSLLISVIGIMYTRSWEERLNESVSGTILGASESELLLRLDQLDTDAKIISGFIIASNFVSEDEFHTFSSSLLDDNHTTRFCFLFNYHDNNYSSSSETLSVAIQRQITSRLSVTSGVLPEKILITVPEGDYLASLDSVTTDDGQRSVVVTVSDLGLLSASNHAHSDSTFIYEDVLGSEVLIGSEYSSELKYTMLTHGDLSVKVLIRQKIVDTAIFTTFRWVIVLVCCVASIIFLFQFFQAKRSIRNFIDLTIDRSRQLSAINSDLVEEIMERARLQAELLTKNYELKDANSQLEYARNQLIQKEKMASLGQMSAGIAHEINNPVAFVKSNVSMMKKYWSRISAYLDFVNNFQSSIADKALSQKIEDSKIENNMESVYKNFSTVLEESMTGLERVQKIVQDLRIFSRAEDSRFQSSNINECIDSAINILRSQIDNRITIHKHYGEIPDAEIMVSQMSQVFINLISNALHAIDGDGNIYISTRTDGRLVEITVEDDGDGIESKTMDKIFDPFFTTKETGKGTGLGLSISYGIVQRHAGNISVESEENNWTRFKISIPITQKNGEHYSD